jgi:hypothetical protein
LKSTWRISWGVYFIRFSSHSPEISLDV